MSEWAPEAETRGGGAAATAAGVMNAVQLRKEGRKVGSRHASPPARPVGSLDCLSSSLEFDELRTKHRRGDGER